MSKPKQVLVVAAHPDDEVLGCGGTLAAHVAAGDKVTALFLSEGVSSRSIPGESRDWTPDIEARETMAQEAASILGIKIAGFLRHPNLRMRDLAMLDITKQVDAVIRDLAPDTVYAHHPGDLNSDHGVAFEATLTACRPRPGLSVGSLLTFEVPSSTEWQSPHHPNPFRPQRYVDVSAHLDTKFAALACYDFEMREFPHPRSKTYIRSLAQYRGAEVSLTAAEAFMVEREIIAG